MRGADDALAVDDHQARRGVDAEGRGNGVEAVAFSNQITGLTQRAARGADEEDEGGDDRGRRPATTAGWPLSVRRR